MLKNKALIVGIDAYSQAPLRGDSEIIRDKRGWFS